MTRKIIGSDEKKPRPQGDWLRLSSEATNLYVPTIADRDDIVVMIAPDAGHGSPASFMPDLAEVEIDAKWFPKGVATRDFTMRRYGWKQQAPAFTGLIIHEAAGHANHSLWMTEKLARRENLSQKEISYLNAATLLEESRIEYKALQERPQDMPWLQASATDIAFGELSKQFTGDADTITASRMAALIMARVDGGSIDPSPDITKMKDMILNIVGNNVYAKMRAIWLDAFKTADTDTAGMLELGKRWVELTGDDGGAEGEGQAGGGTGGEEGDGTGAALKKLLGEIAKDTSDEASGEAERRSENARMKKFVGARHSEGQQQQEAEKEASKVFHASPSSAYENPYNALTGYRAPNGEERRLASRTRKELESAYTRERSITKTRSQLPPGRPDMRAGMKGQALRDQGLMDISEPFRRKQRKRNPTPPLSVGIIQDASGSQDRAAASAASGAWIVATAAHQLDAKVAMVTFGNATTRVISPGEKPPGVPVITANSGNHKFSWGVKALEGVLGLMNRGTARLLIIMTDGIWESDQIAMRDPALKRYVEAGVHVMWVQTDGRESYGNQYVPRVTGVNVVMNDHDRFDHLPAMIAKGASETLMKEVGM
jgi:hypothetical protein